MTNQSSICAKCKNNMCNSNNDTINITERRLRWLKLHIILKDNFIACLMCTCTSGKRSSDKLVFLHWTTDIYSEQIRRFSKFVICLLNVLIVSIQRSLFSKVLTILRYRLNNVTNKQTTLNYKQLKVI